MNANKKVRTLGCILSQAGDASAGDENPAAQAFGGKRNACRQSAQAEGCGEENSKKPREFSVFIEFSK
jgi:hypothetical protein